MLKERKRSILILLHISLLVSFIPIMHSEAVFCFEWLVFVFEIVLLASCEKFISRGGVGHLAGGCFCL